MLREATANHPHCTASAEAADNAKVGEDSGGDEGGRGRGTRLEERKLLLLLWLFMLLLVMLLLLLLLLLLVVIGEVCSRTASRSTAQASSSREK